MASPFAETFMKRLQEIEQSRDAGPLVALFADDAELSTLAKPDPVRGADGVRAFWTEYLDAFKTVRSTFTAVSEGDGVTVLEWASAGELPAGGPISYRGVSVLEAAGDKVKKFRTYYDTAAFVAKPADAG